MWQLPSGTETERTRGVLVYTNNTNPSAKDVHIHTSHEKIYLHPGTHDPLYNDDNDDDDDDDNDNDKENRGT